MLYSRRMAAVRLNPFAVMPLDFEFPEIMSFRKREVIVRGDYFTKLTYGALLKDGLGFFLYKNLASLPLVLRSFKETPLTVGIDNEVLTLKALPFNANLEWMLRSMYLNLEVSYRLRYCQLNRKLRKIIKNKYKFQKRNEWIPPRNRHKHIAALLKKNLLLQEDVVFNHRLAAVFSFYFSDPLTSDLYKLAKQNQGIAVSTLSQTTVRV